MKVVFLDFDGVLNSLGFFQREHGPLDRLDPAAVQRLDLLVRRAGAKVVVSSSWRVGRTLDALRQLLAQAGYDGEVVGCTPDLGSRVYVADGSALRSLEIRAWLDAQTEPVEAYVVLDDGALDELAPCFVRTTFATGLCDEHVEEALAILMAPTHDEP